MKETGIIMSGDHPKKILDGTKTMTRRTYGLEKINDMPYLWGEPRYDEEVGMWLFWQPHTGDCIHIKCPYGQVGDRLWVRETWATSLRIDHMKPSDIGEAFCVPLWYKADNELSKEGEPLKGKWRPSIFMPRWASRITREITGLRPERVQDISEEDAKAEGVPGIATHKPYPRQYRDSFEALWNSINGKKYPWDGNWWVWAIGF